MKPQTAIGILFFGATSAAFAEVDFARDIRPILTKHCTECHGGVRSKANLSFVRKDSAFAEAKSGAKPIVPGDLSKSELVARITSHDEDERMPPEEPLGADEIETLRSWIAEGATWPKHWSFENPKPNPGKSVDSLIAAELENVQMLPSPEAPRHTLIRRLYLDLLGLPPTPEEVTAFVTDNSPDAYSRLVDKTLTSPHFGERWARHWLDAARYADSDGYEKDNARPDAWRWRKWVIDAINADMPFNQFTIEQLAGDLLPDATPEQKLATAFHRQTLFNREGGVDPEEDRTKRTIDRTNTTASVWLGLTAECAQCHDHPYDPITQREYYGLYAFFNEAGEGDAEVFKSDPAHLADHDNELKAVRSDRMPAFESWLASLRTADQPEPLAFHPVEPTALASIAGARFVKQDDGSYLVADGKPLGTDLYRLEIPTGGKKVTGIKIELVPHSSLPAKGPGRTGNGNFVLSEIRVSAGGELVGLLEAKSDYSQKEWEIQNAIDGDRSNGWAISPQMGRPHFAEFTFAKEIAAGSFTVELDQNYAAAAGKEGHQIGRFRLSLMTGSAGNPPLPAPLQKLATAKTLSPEQREQLADHYFTKIDPATKAAIAKIEKARSGAKMKVRVMRAQPRETFVFHRGDFLQPKKDDGKVIPGTPAVLPGMDSVDSKSPTRLDLANWVVDPNNPLTARVAANDVWTRLFGTGLVATKGDWGTRCQPPLHARLLDHLAGKLIEKGWSRKALIREVVLSKTYRQSSDHRVDATKQDPNNALFHRQNRRRVEAEIMRDVFLSASGLLQHEVGSPSVFPPIPPDVAAQSYANSFKWTTSKGADRYRRGMYTFFKRTAADPNLLSFDCPDANVSVIERGRSNTPIMALATLGNEVFHESAQALAKHILENDSLTDETTRINQAFLLCIARPPNEKEAAQITNLLEVSRRYYRAQPKDAETLTKPHRAESSDVIENAAWVAAARIILNLDETITRE